MSPALINMIRVVVASDRATLQSNASNIGFKGFYILYEKPDNQNDNNQEFEALNELKKADVVELAKIIPKQHFTEPAPRYTEASMIKKIRRTWYW